MQTKTSTSNVIELAKLWEAGGTIENPKALLRELIGEAELLRSCVERLEVAECERLTDMGHGWNSPTDEVRLRGELTGIRAALSYLRGPR
ncbi:hypothetical protein [Mycobacteroides abscessus]|uniref:hypothetical protein n=1 Tax=Mycobacteroides abscessus TaxID=36809 RepID=UPI000C258839|nr:hypothetical protein [Mycobacteroides abscessus]